MERNDAAKIVISILLFAFLVFLGTQIYTYHLKVGEAAAGYKSAAAELQNAEKDQAQLTSDLGYYLNPANMEKEIESRFNYSVPGEKTIILVPESSSSGQ